MHIATVTGIVHRDLKLENMVMLNNRDDSPVKIADFGLSKFFSNDNVLSTMCGSPQYVAPEVGTHPAGCWLPVQATRSNIHVRLHKVLQAACKGRVVPWG
jgi:serine/threonine protein kinase